MKIIPDINLEVGKCGFYGGSYCANRQLLFIPERIKSKIFIYSLKDDRLIKSISLPGNPSPEVTAITSYGDVLIASRQSQYIFKINKNLELNILGEYADLFATSFSTSCSGKVLVGNCQGPPLLIYDNKLIPLTNIGNNSYDSVWLTRDKFIMSFPHHDC